MKRFFILAAFLTALVGCQSVDSNVTDPSAEAHGRESLKAIEFSIRDTSATKAPTPITSLSEFNVSATSGSAGSEASKLSNVVFTSSNGVFRSDALWPSSDPGYHFYASNVAMTHTASGQTVSISTIDKDVVCAYLASPNYKVKNDLTFNHILARVGTVSFTNLDLCSNVKLSMKYSGSGTYNISTGAWSGVGSQSSKELTTADNNFWIIPGNYQATLTYTDANGNPQSKTISKEFKAGLVNNISAKLDGSVVVKTEDEYEAPTFTLGTISDVPAGGGDSGTPSVTSIGQRKRVKKTLADGTVKYDPDWTAVSNPDYTIQYGKTLSSLSDNCPSYHGDNLGTTAKARTKLGDVYVRVKIGDKTTDKTLEVYQQANEETFGSMSIKSFSYSPKVAAAGGTASPTVTYELPYSWTSGASGKYTTDASLAYSTVTDNAGATLNASTGVVTWAANNGAERSETERVTVSLKGKSSATDATSTQEGDVVSSYGNPTVTLSYSPASVGATGGTANPSVSYSQTVTYASGKTSTITTGASSITYSGSATGFTLDSSSGVVTVAANQGSARGITVTVSVIVNGKTGTANATVNQGDDSVTGYDDPVVTFSYSPASHGAAGGTSTPNVSYTQTVHYASGRTTTETSGGSISYSGSATGFTLGTDGKVIAAANQGSARNITVTAKVTAHGKSGSKTATVSQSGDSVDYYDAPTGLSISCGDIPASGGTISEGSTSGKATQVVHYKSGATTTIDVSVSKSWSSAVSASNLQKTVKSRTKVGTLTLTYSANGKSNTASCDVYQAKNERHYGSTATKNHTRTGSVSYGSIEYYGSTTWSDKSYGSEYLNNTTTGTEVQDADTFGSWETTSTSVDKYDYAVSFAVTSWSPGPDASSKANAITAYHYEKTVYNKRRTITHNYHTPYTNHYYRNWTKTASRSYSRSTSQKCNYIEYRTDTFDSGATEYVEENKSHTEYGTDYGTDYNYDSDSGSEWYRDASGNTTRTSSGGYETTTTKDPTGTKKTDSPTPSSDQSWLTYSGGTMSVSANSSTSSRSAKLSVSNGTASATCSVTQDGKSITYSISVNPTSLTFGCDDAGSGSKKSVTVTCPEGDWEISSTSSVWTATKSGNTLYVYPNAANTSTTSNKTGTVTVRCKGDTSKTASVSLTQEKPSYDIDVN